MPDYSRTDLRTPLLTTCTLKADVAWITGYCPVAARDKREEAGQIGNIQLCPTNIIKKLLLITVVSGTLFNVPCSTNTSHLSPIDEIHITQERISIPPVANNHGYKFTLKKDQKKYAGNKLISQMQVITAFNLKNQLNAQ